MDSLSGCDILLVFTFSPKLQYKKCVHLWNNFPCISTLDSRIHDVSKRRWVKFCLFSENVINDWYFDPISMIYHISMVMILSPWNHFNFKKKLHIIEKFKAFDSRHLSNHLVFFSFCFPVESGKQSWRITSSKWRFFSRWYFRFFSRWHFRFFSRWHFRFFSRWHFRFVKNYKPLFS